MGIFTGITILDLAQGVSGNLCAMVLSDLGAEVIHVEQPQEESFAGKTYSGVSVRELSLLRGKKRVALDLRSKKQYEAFLRLAAGADVFIEDRGPGKSGALGAGYEDLVKVNEQICYTAISAYGQTGPKKDLPASDLVLQAASGLMGITGEMGGVPMRAGIPAPEMYTGLYAAAGTIGMLIHKKKTGEGQYLDISVTDCMLANLENAAVNYMANGKVQERIGNRHSVNVPFQEFHTKDNQDILITINRDNTYAALCKILGCEEFITDPRYCTGELRRQHREECTQEVIDRVINWNVDDIEKELTAAGIPCATINSVDMIVNSENTEARGMLIEGSHPVVGKYRMPNSPFKFGGKPAEVNGAVSERGQDTRTVLDRFGIDCTNI